MAVSERWSTLLLATEGAGLTMGFPVGLPPGDKRQGGLWKQGVGRKPSEQAMALGGCCVSRHRFFMPKMS